MGREEGGGFKESPLSPPHFLLPPISMHDTFTKVSCILEDVGPCSVRHGVPTAYELLKVCKQHVLCTLLTWMLLQVYMHTGSFI